MCCWHGNNPGWVNEHGNVAKWPQEPAELLLLSLLLSLLLPLHSCLWSQSYVCVLFVAAWPQDMPNCGMFQTPI